MPTILLWTDGGTYYPKTFSEGVCGQCRITTNRSLIEKSDAVVIHCRSKNKFPVLNVRWKTSSFFIAVFSWGWRGQQREIRPLHFTIFHHLHYFAWVKNQTIPSKILNVIDPFISWSSNRSFLICIGAYSLFGESFLKYSAYMAKLSKLKSFNSEKEQLGV